MADVELVIKIPEEDFESCKKRTQMRINIVWDAIANGIPLPKGHGRLIDADKIEFEYYYGEWFVTESAIDYQPTVIEADVESEG